MCVCLCVCGLSKLETKRRNNNKTEFNMRFIAAENLLIKFNRRLGRMYTYICFNTQFLRTSFFFITCTQCTLTATKTSCVSCLQYNSNYNNNNNMFETEIDIKCSKFAINFRWFNFYDLQWQPSMNNSNKK